jgi:hypothetical protein
MAHLIACDSCVSLYHILEIPAHGLDEACKIVGLVELDEMLVNALDLRLTRLDCKRKYTRSQRYKDLLQQQACWCVTLVYIVFVDFHIE